MARDEFPIDIKKKLAQRAGYQCSICNVITVGPSDEGIEAVNLTGIAAHISGASSGPGSRRFDNRLTPQERASIENGIWLCNTHADLIDGDEITFTTSFLKLIKQNHEQRIKLKQSGLTVERGVITKMEFSNFGPVSTPLLVEFKDLNVVFGNNGLGKTLMFELIASLSDKFNLDRWVNERREKSNSFCNIYYFKNQADKFSFSIDKNNKISYTFNDSLIPFLAPAMTIFYLKENFSRFLNRIPKEEREKRHLISLMAEYFGLKNDEFIFVVETISKDRKHFCNDINLDDSKDDLIIKFSSNPKSPVLPFNGLSGGEQEIVLLEITLKIATYFSKFNSTILLIEYTSFGNIDIAGINHLFEILRKEKLNFQFFFTAMGNKEDKRYETLNLENFNVIELYKSKTGETLLR